jgi:hypothetical protein
MTPDSTELWFLPLGGCGEIGMNLNLFGHDGRWLMVDCGVTFEQGPGGNRVQMPNPEFIAKQFICSGNSFGARFTPLALPLMWSRQSCAAKAATRPLPS